MGKFYAWVCRVEAVAAMAALVASTFLIFLAAVLRSVGRPINWGMDMSLFLFSWCVFLSADVGLREDRLVSLDLVTSRLPARARLWCAMASHLLILAFLLAMIHFGSFLSYTTRNRAFQGIPDFSYTWVTISVPVAALLMTITICLKIRDTLRALRRAPDPAARA